MNHNSQVQRRKIAITGGPSGGKTTLIESLQKDLGHYISIVPESASILYRGGFPRKKTNLRQKHAQKAIYYIQRELELLTEEESINNMIICDRGSLDALAYWPEDGTSFLDSIPTTLAAENARYDFVLHLDTAPVDYYDSGNPIRTETFDEALNLNIRTKKAWENHPQRIIIPNQTDFLSKMMLCLQIIQAIKTYKPYHEILKLVGANE